MIYIYPSYQRVLETKKRMYPEEVNISEGKCEVPLQNLLDKTCSSIIDLVSSNYQDMCEKNVLCFANGASTAVQDILHIIRNLKLKD